MLRGLVTTEKYFSEETSRKIKMKATPVPGVGLGERTRRRPRAKEQERKGRKGVGEKGVAGQTREELNIVVRS